MNDPIKELLSLPTQVMYNQHIFTLRAIYLDQYLRIVYELVAVSPERYSWTGSNEPILTWNNPFYPPGAQWLYLTGDIYNVNDLQDCLLYTSPSPRDQRGSRMPSSA